MYLGTPYELFWSDYKDKKYFGIFDTESHKLELIGNPNRMFFKIVYDDSKMQMDEVLNADYSRYASSYVKVVVVNKQNPYMFDKLMDELYKVAPLDVNIVEDFSDTTLEGNDDELINQAEDTMTILYKYIDASTTETNKDVGRLKTLMRELYVEALSKENVE